MAAFIKQENQRVLWNTIQNVNLFHQVLKEPQKPLWFREIIGVFYEKCRDQRLSRLDLENLNRQVMRYMVDSLKMMAQESSRQIMDTTQRGATTMAPIRKQVSFHDTTTTNGLLDFRPEFASANLEKRAIQSQQYASEFSARQQEYDQMMRRDLPPEPNFKEEVSDVAIQNIDELLEKHRIMRELDIAPPPLQPQPRRIQPTTGSHKTLVFEEDIREPIQVTDLPSQDPIQELKDILIGINKIILEIKENFSISDIKFSQNGGFGRIKPRRVIRIQDDEDEDTVSESEATPPEVAEPKSENTENPLIEQYELDEIK